MKDPGDTRLREIDRRELVYLVPIIVLIVFMGLFPGVFLRKMDASVARYLDSVKTRPATSLGLTQFPEPDQAAETLAGSER